MADINESHVSGVTNQIALSKSWLGKAGHEVYLFTFGDRDTIDHERKIVQTAGMPIIKTGVFLNLRYTRQARNLLHTMDIAHVHHPFISGTLAMRYCTPRNIPIVFTHHTRYDLHTQAYLPILSETITQMALKAYLAPFYRACDLVIAPSESMRNILLERYHLDSRVEVIPNGVDLSAFREDVQPVDRSVFGFSGEDIICTFIGRLSPEKNLSMLLRAFYSVSTTCDRVRLLLVGDGPDRKNLETQVKHMKIGHKVHFTGIVEYKEIPAHLTASDVFVTPSKTETFGLSTVEAMAAGLPALGIESPGTSDIIEDGITGLIAIDDLAAFTAKLTLLSTNQDYRRRLGKQAVQAAKKYDIRATTGMLLQKYQELVEKAQQHHKSPQYKFRRFLDRFQ